MKKIVALGFPNEEAAEEFRGRIELLLSEEALELDDLVMVTVNDEGRTKLHHGFSTVTGGAVVGGMLGGIVGLLFLNPVAGAALGAAGGAAVGKMSGDYGIDDDFIRETSAALTPGTAALFLMVRQSDPEKVEAAIHGAGATVITTTLDADAEARLKDALKDTQE